MRSTTRSIAAFATGASHARSAVMQAYMLDASWVIIDTGPGSGALMMNAIMSSHGFVIPIGIDQKATSTIRSLAEKIERWTNPHDQFSYIGIRQEVNRTVVEDGERKVNRYPVPMHLPKFLGLVYSRLGLRGRQFPYNQYAAMSDCNNTLGDVLMPVLQSRQMLLTNGIYDEARNRLPAAFDQFNEEQANALISVPAAPVGVVGILVEFGQLQQMSERDSIPVFFIPNEPWSMRRPRQNMLQQFIQAVEQGQPPPFSIYAPAVYEACPANNRATMERKVEHLHSILMNMLTMLDADFDAAVAPADGGNGAPGGGGDAGHAAASADVSVDAMQE